MKIAETTVSKYRKLAVLEGILEWSNKGYYKLVRQDVYETIAKLFHSGISNKEISIIAKVSLSVVYKYRRKLIAESKL